MDYRGVCFVLKMDVTDVTNAKFHDGIKCIKKQEFPAPRTGASKMSGKHISHPLDRPQKGSPLAASSSFLFLRFTENIQIQKIRR